MKVNADLSDSTIELGNNGVEFAIANNDGTHRGTLRIGKATVEWREGRTRKGNGRKIKLEKLIEALNSGEI